LEAEHPGGLQVDHQLEPCRLIDRQVGRLLALENPRGIDEGSFEWFRGILTRVNADGLRALKLLAVERDMTLQALGVDALNDMLVKNGKRPVVKNPLL
jgi:hypothetical protein